MKGFFVKCSVFARSGPFARPIWRPGKSRDVNLFPGLDIGQE
jgi:hypothetical protein